MTGFSLRLGRTGWLALLVVVTALIVLGVIQYRVSVVSAKEATLRTELFGMRDAIDRYQADRQGCPLSLQTLVDLGYLRAIPRDPMTGSETTW